MTLIVPLLCHAQDLSCRGGCPNPDMVGAKKNPQALVEGYILCLILSGRRTHTSKTFKRFLYERLLIGTERELAWQRIVVSPAPFGILGTVDLVRNNAQADGLAVLLTDRRREQAKAVL